MGWDIRKLSRREFLSQMGTGALVAAGWPSMGASLNLSDENPHFFLYLPIIGGMDCSYLYDARPLAMTAANLQQNYTEKEPVQVTGVNGQKAWASTASAGLKELHRDISIVNGMVMTPSFDGHLECLMMFLAGSPFGGEGFVPHLNTVGDRSEVDYYEDTTFFGRRVTNRGKALTLSVARARALVERIQLFQPITGSSSLGRFITNRFENAGRGAGAHSLGSKRFHDGVGAGSALRNRFAKIELDPLTEDPVLNALNLTKHLFQQGIARSSLVRLGQGVNFDTHDQASCALQPTTFANTADQIKTVIKFLKETAFDESRSLFDVTTVAFGSEFSRTMRQKGKAMNETGTDHNNLTNSVFLAGKGIRGGHIVGESDWQTPEESLSKAHETLDPDRLKLMGRPFDFDAFQVRSDKPESFEAKDYISPAHVVNTLYEVFGVDKKYYREIERNGQAAPTLKPLLA